MLKNLLAMMVIGGFVTSNSFAAPFHLEKKFMENHTATSSVVSSSHTQNSQSKFSGTWTGVCSFIGHDEEMKIRINEDNYGLSMIDLINEGDDVSYFFNVVGSETNSDKNSNDISIHRLTKVNENTLKLEGVDTRGSQLPTVSGEKGLFSMVYTSMFIVNNNQLTINLSGTTFHENINSNVESKCTFKRAG